MVATHPKQFYSITPQAWAGKGIYGKIRVLVIGNATSSRSATS
ncbi:hypothetical protein T07_5114 [Trichinella nelsoni]|uniref:Uncharacterized protein n=1 Tax=Trichinella nelsoni TaxID=6336 RepID=A0A0V0RCK9_9BILA|nr:hypothetical protein T07_9344 [Trichinella nelsoni]KRX12324.1 hypothetical protein T07_5114 [Trichinella nelsoni]